MPRKARVESGTGMFHVMMRGINHQNRRTSERRAKLAWAIPSEKEEDEVNIFEEQEDYHQFIATLDRMRFRYVSVRTLDQFEFVWDKIFF